MNKTVRNIVICLIVFMLLAFGTTAILINKQNKMGLTESPQGDIQNKQEQGIDLYATYDENDLLINELVEQDNGIEIKIPQIDGLKNTNVQDKINQDMKNRVYDFVNSMEKLQEVSFNTTANFGNVISIRCAFSIKEYEEIKYLCLNYELINGERLKFEDLFTANTDITQLVSKAFYENIATQEYYNRLQESNDYSEQEKVFSPNEYEIYKMVKNFMNQKDKQFVFTPTDISFDYEKDGGEIKFINVSDNIAIYNKYKTDKSIYINDNVGYDKIFTCADTVPYSYFDSIVYGYVEDNFWCDKTMSKDYTSDLENSEMTEEFKTFKNMRQKEIDNIITEYRQIAKQNPDKYYILLLKGEITPVTLSKFINEQWEYTSTDMAKVSWSTSFYEMSKEVYESKYKQEIIDMYRNKYFAMRGGAIIYYEEDVKDSIKPVDNGQTKLYNYKTGQELTKLTDIFYEDSNYMDVINKEVRNRLFFDGYSEEQISETLGKLKYEFSGSYINVIVPNEEYPYTINFDDFDKASFKLINN